jgi:LPS-assembly lipoprotein
MLEGSSYGRAAFDRVESIFANVRAKQDAEDRAATTVANDLKTRLAAFLSTAA